MVHVIRYHMIVIVFNVFVTRKNTNILVYIYIYIFLHCLFTIVTQIYKNVIFKIIITYPQY